MRERRPTLAGGLPSCTAVAAARGRWRPARGPLTALGRAPWRQDREWGPAAGARAKLHKSKVQLAKEAAAASRCAPSAAAGAPQAPMGAGVPGPPQRAAGSRLAARGPWPHGLRTGARHVG